VRMMRDGIQWIQPDWPAPSNVRAASTLRLGGVSTAPFDSLNLALHVGDDPSRVDENRRRVKKTLQLPAEPCWLQQVHGVEVINAATYSVPAVADACLATEPAKVCVVMTADCLPVLFCNRDGTRVAAAHAGWRGLAAGVLVNTVQALKCLPSELIAWIGPAIGPAAFEVGDEVRTTFIDSDAVNAACFTRNSRERWMADLYQLACNELARLGVQDIFVEQACTVTDASQFFSYRRDGQTGRMASMIWLHPD